MAKTIVNNVQIGINGDGFAGGTNGTFTNTISNSGGLVPTSVATANGSVTVTIPATALGFYVVPPPGSALAKTYKGVAGDTGIVTAPTQPFGPVIMTAGQQASFVITTTGIETVMVFWL